jgi:hypothetical protein
MIVSAYPKLANPASVKPLLLINVALETFWVIIFGGRKTNLEYRNGDWEFAPAD